MNRLNRMTGLVPVIIGLFCACQGTAKQVDVETDLKAMYADLPFSMYGAQNETYIEGWEKKTSNLLIYKRLCNV